MTRKSKNLMLIAAAVGVFFYLKKKAASAVAIAPAATTPTGSVAPTAAATTTNMQALAEYINPTMSGIAGGYGRLPVRYPSPSPFQRYN